MKIKSKTKREKLKGYSASLQISIDFDAPLRVAPALMSAIAVFASRMPPAAFMPKAEPNVSRISFTSSAVAPPVEKPVEVFAKAAPAF